MANFFYTAKSSSGEEKTGTREANNKSELARFLRQEEFFLISAKALGQSDSLSSFNQKIPLSFWLINLIRPISLFDKMLFAKHLAVMVRAGLSLNQALEVLTKQTKNKRFAEIITDINKTIQTGVSLSDALARHSQVFSNIFVSMIRVGESGGKLEEVLELLATQMDKDNQLISKVRGAFVYPAIIIIAMIIVGVIMMIVVVPKLISTFEELKVDLPITTKIVIGISKFLTQHTIGGILLIFLFVAMVIRLFKTTYGKKSFDWITLRFPIFGPLIQKINSARLARTLSSLIESGVPIVKSLQVVSETLFNDYYVTSLKTTAIEIQKGQALSKLLSKYPSLYPPLITQMIEVGEKTGTLNNVLKELADFYEEDVSNITKNLAVIIEPLLMIIIGAIIGFFAVSMIQPIYSMMNNV